MSGGPMTERTGMTKELEQLKASSKAQWTRIDAQRERLDEHDLRLERIGALLKGAGGNGHPSWSERLILLEDWQRRQEKLLAALPAQLTEIKTQLHILLSQQQVQTNAKSNAMWTAIGSLIVALLVGMSSAALLWWSSH